MRDVTRKWKLYPRGDRVLIRADMPDEKSDGGIILPETSKLREPGTIGRVIAVGGKCKKPEDGGLKQNDHVLFGRYSGHQLPDRPDLIVMREGDVLLVLEEEPTSSLVTVQ